MSVQDSVPLKKVILIFLAMLGQWPHMEGNHIVESEPQHFWNLPRYPNHQVFLLMQKKVLKEYLPSQNKQTTTKKHGIFWTPYEIISILWLESQLSKALCVGIHLYNFYSTFLVIKIRVQPDPKHSSSHPYPFTFLVTVEHTLAVELKAIGTFVHAFKHRRWWLTHHWDAATLLPGSILQTMYLQELSDKI